MMGFYGITNLAKTESVALKFGDALYLINNPHIFYNITYI